MSGFGLFFALLMTLSVSSLPQVRAIGMTVSGKISPASVWFETGRMFNSH